MRQPETGRGEHAMRRAFVRIDGRNGRETSTGVVVAWPFQADSEALADRVSRLDRLKAENTELRRQVVDLALAIQSLREEIRDAAIGRAG